MIIKNLTINLIYVDNNGARWRLEELIGDEGYISDEHFNLDEFFHAIGGIELIKDDHYIFHQSFEYYDLLSLVTFLIYSLVSLNELDEKLFEEFNVYKSENKLSQIIESSGDILLLENENNQPTIKVSYIKNSLYPIFRNDFHFKDLQVEKSSWINASKIALSEYFKLIEKIDLVESELNKDTFLKVLLKKWNSLLAPLDL